MSATNLKRTLTGTVVSDKMDKTVTVWLSERLNILAGQNHCVFPKNIMRMMKIMSFIRVMW